MFVGDPADALVVEGGTASTEDGHVFLRLEVETQGGAGIPDQGLVGQQSLPLLVGVLLWVADVEDGQFVVIGVDAAIVEFRAGNFVFSEFPPQELRA